MQIKIKITQKCIVLINNSTPEAFKYPRIRVLRCVSLRMCVYQTPDGETKQINVDAAQIFFLIPANSTLRLLYTMCE